MSDPPDETPPIHRVGVALKLTPAEMASLGRELREPGGFLREHPTTGWVTTGSHDALDLQIDVRATSPEHAARQVRMQIERAIGRLLPDDTTLTTYRLDQFWAGCEE